jgi:hypothetical protein
LAIIRQSQAAGADVFIEDPSVTLFSIRRQHARYSPSTCVDAAADA